MIIYQEENNFWAEFTQLVVKSWVYQKCRILAEKPTILWQTKLTNTLQAVTKMFAFVMFA